MISEVEKITMLDVRTPANQSLPVVTALITGRARTQSQLIQKALLSGEGSPTCGRAGSGTGLQKGKTDNELG